MCTKAPPPPQKKKKKYKSREYIRPKINYSSFATFSTAADISSIANTFVHVPPLAKIKYRKYQVISLNKIMY